MTDTTTAQAPVAALRVALDDPAASWPDVVLREHQLEALDQLHGRLANGATRTWVDAPTGSGKTVTFCALASALNGASLVLVPRRNLADQTVAALARHFPSVTVNTGTEAAGRPGVTIATYQAALRHADRMDWDELTLVICDEAHTALGSQTRRLLDRAQSAIIVGFTATGATTTGHVEQVFGPVAATLDRRSAIDRGILCPLRSLRVERAVDLSDVARVRGDFDQGSLGRALDRARWHSACADVWLDHFAPLELAGVAYTATVAQAHALADELASRGVRAAAVSGQTPARELAKALADFGAQRIDVLCNADLLTEGWDETRASVVMHLAPTTSERVFVQRLGRVMRPAPGKEAVSVEFLPAGDPMGVQTSHDIFGRGWYKPLGRVAGPPDSGDERGKLAKAAQLLAERQGDRAELVNPGAPPAEIAAGLADGGWRQADPGVLPVSVLEEWIEAAAQDVTYGEIVDAVTGGLRPESARAWFALSVLVARRARDGADQPLWRAWATALLVQPELRGGLPVDAARTVLERLRMTAKERLRALWWHAHAAKRWDRLTQLEQLGRSSDRRRRWAVLDEASEWAPAWAWDVSRGLADDDRPGRNQELGRIAAWEANHIITNGGVEALIGNWLRAAGEPAPDPVPRSGPAPLRLGELARLLLTLGPGDVPTRSEHLRTASRAAAACGGWAELRGVLDAMDWTSAEARRALRAAVASAYPKALVSRRAWNSLRARAQRLPAAAAVGIGEPASAQGGGSGDGSGDGRPARRRRRRRRLHGPAPDAAAAAAAADAPADSAGSPDDAQPKAASQNGPAPGGRPRRRRRRRRLSQSAVPEGGGAEGAPPAADPPPPPSE